MRIITVMIITITIMTTTMITITITRRQSRTSTITTEPLCIGWFAVAVK